MYEKLSEKLYNTLKPLDGDIVKEISRVENVNPSVFPFISITEDDTSEDEVIFDTTSNMGVYRFKIRVVHSLANTGFNTGCREVREIVDEVLAKLRSVREWDDCVMSASFGVRWGYMNEENFRIAEISVSFRVLLDTM